MRPWTAAALIVSGGLAAWGLAAAAEKDDGQGTSAAAFTRLLAVGDRIVLHSGENGYGVTVVSEEEAATGATWVLHEKWEPVAEFGTPPFGLPAGGVYDLIAEPDGEDSIAVMRTERKTGRAWILTAEMSWRPIEEAVKAPTPVP